VRNASAVSAMMPPSPLLSARVMNRTYFRETVIVIAQKTTERMPRTLASVTATGCGPLKISLTVYSGLVPMSPKTTPIAASAAVASPDFSPCGVCSSIIAPPRKQSVPSRPVPVRESAVSAVRGCRIADNPSFRA